MFSYQNQHTSGQRIWKIQCVYDKTDESEHKHPCVKLFYDAPWVLALLMLTTEAGHTSVWCLSYECIFMTSIGGGFELYSAVSRLGGGLGQFFRPGIWRQSRSILQCCICSRARKLKQSKPHHWVCCLTHLSLHHSESCMQTPPQCALGGCV